MSEQNSISKGVSYSESDFIYKSSWNSPQQSWFDEELCMRWNNAMDKGYFRYKLKIVGTKVLPGKYGFVAQLNPDRGHNRRQPADIQTLNQPFDDSKFNFTKIPNEEVLFDIVRRGSEQKSRDCCVINASPFEMGHSLFVPQIEEKRPQAMDAESLQTVVEMLLLSASPALRVGFNSLCGYASVNHLHYHLYYLKHKMTLETVDVQLLSGPCYEIQNYPGRGFAFELNEKKDVAQLARNVNKLSKYLQENDVAHNLVAMRGKSFRRNHVREKVDEMYDTIRVFVWARASSFGAKDSAGFAPALCELFGHLNIKEEKFYENITEEIVSDILKDITHDTFVKIRPDIIKLYQTDQS